MKFFLLPMFICAGLCPAFSSLFAQSKQAEFDLGKKYSYLEFIAGGDNDFFMLTETKVPMSTAGPTSNSIFKFNADLQPVWKEPIVFKTMGGMAVYMGHVNMLSYTNPTDHATTDYLVEDATKYLYQILPDGTVTKKDSDIPKKELNEEAAFFTDAQGLNILTIVGDETFPTGLLNWYTFSHDHLKMTKQQIKLPLPTSTDKDNESGWRLNEVTASGLYFYYVSYKNKVKDDGRPILTAHVVHVDPKGKAGAIVDIDLEVEKYTIMPVGFHQDVYPGLYVGKPELYETGINGTGSSARAYFIPNDNAYMGIKISESARRIYTVTASNQELKVSKDGTSSGDVLGRSPTVRTLEFGVYELSGKKIAQKSVKLPSVKLAMSDNYSSGASQIDIIPLAGDDGVVYKYLNNGNGILWAVNNQGEIGQEQKFKTCDYKEMTARNHYDVFAGRYYSLRDFKNSPYVAKEKSPAYQSFQKLEEKEERNALYLSLKDYDLFSVWDAKDKTIKFNAFPKN